jgi:hypothetical protein
MAGLGHIPHRIQCTGRWRQANFLGRLTSVSSVDPRTVKRAWAYADSPAGTSTYAFPTSVTSYTGLNGTGTTFTANLTWDYKIGKPVTTKDIKGQITGYCYGPPNSLTSPVCPGSFSATDGLDRLWAVTKPDGGWTTVSYSVSVRATPPSTPAPARFTAAWLPTPPA